MAFKAVELISQRQAVVFNPATQSLKRHFNEEILSEVEFSEPLNENHFAKFLLVFQGEGRQSHLPIMPYYEQGELNFHKLELNYAPTELERVRTLIIKQLIDALCELKDKKLSLNDIKTNNILMKTLEHVIFTDYGLADQAARIFLGSTAFISPEFFSGAIAGTSKYDSTYAPTHTLCSHKKDVWSLGLVFLEMYCPNEMRQSLVDQVHVMCENFTYGAHQLRSPPRPHTYTNLIAMYAFDAPPKILKLLRFMLEMDPIKRPDALFLKTWVEENL